jgi:hypothetical protein
LARGLIVALVAAAPNAVRAEAQTAETTEPTATARENTESAVATGHRLALFADFGGPRREFTLFKDGSLAGWDGSMGRLELDFHRQAIPGPRLVGLPTMMLGLSFRGEPDPEGGRRIAIGPIYREWSDLTPWEKFGVALSYAGAAAAAVHFAAEIARALDH